MKTYLDLLGEDQNWVHPINEFMMFEKLVKPYRKEELELFKLSLLHNIFDDHRIDIGDFFESSINTNWNRKTLRKVATFLWRNPEYLFYYITNSSYSIYLEMLGIQVMDQKTSIPTNEDERKKTISIGKVHLAVYIIIIEELRKLGLQFRDFPISVDVYFTDCKIKSCSTPCERKGYKLNTIFELQDDAVLNKLKYDNLISFFEGILELVRTKNDYSLSEQRDRMLDPMFLNLEEDNFQVGDTEEILVRFIHSLTHGLPFFTEESIKPKEFNAHTKNEENCKDIEVVFSDCSAKVNVSSSSNLRDKIKTGNFKNNLKNLVDSMATRFLDKSRFKEIESSSCSDDKHCISAVSSDGYYYYHSIYDQEPCGYTDKPFMVKKYYALLNGQCVACFENEEEVQNYISLSNHTADCLDWKAEIQFTNHSISSDKWAANVPMTCIIDYYPKKKFLLTRSKR